MWALFQVLLYGCMLMQACKIARGAVIPDPPTLPQTDNGTDPCSDRTPNLTVTNDDVERRALFKQELLYKLNIGNFTEDPPEDLVIPPEVLASYRAAVALEETISAQARAHERLDGCREKETFYGKNVQLFFPSTFEGDIPSLTLFDWDLISDTKRFKRGEKNDDKSPINEKDSFDSNLKKATTTEENIQSTTALPQVTPLFHQSPISAEQKSLQELLSPMHYDLVFSNIRNSLPAHTPVWSASLQLYKQKIVYDSSLVKREPNPTENIEIYWMSTAVGEDKKMVDFPVLIKSQDVFTDDDGYVSFDITEGVRKWLNDGTHEELVIKVVIHCPESVSSGLLFLPSVQFSTTKEAETPNLVVEVLLDSGSSESNRTKRNTIESSSRDYCLENPDEINCCIKELTVHFEKDLGLNWVLAPKTFQFTYCQGLCPRISPLNTLNSEYRSRLRATNPTSSPEPCCVPHDTRPMTVLTYEHGKLVLKQIDGMIVDSCQCR